MAISRLNRSYQSQFWLGGVNIVPVAPVFAFDACPPGSVWTGTISVTAANTLTMGTGTANPAGSFSHNDILVNMIWTLYRNGQPEMTWIGLSQAINVQLFANDHAVVVGTLPASGVSVQLNNQNPINLICNYLGFSEDELTARPVVPYTTGTNQSSPFAATSEPNVITPATIFQHTGAGVVTFPMAALGPYASVRIWRAYITLSASNTATNGVSVWIADNAGDVFLSCGVVGNQSQTIALDLGGLVVGGTLLPIQLHIVDLSATATDILTSAGLYISFETLI
jgi:hypothetical protein